VQLKAGLGGMTAAEIARIRRALEAFSPDWVLAAFDGEQLHFLPDIPKPINFPLDFGKPSVSELDHDLDRFAIVHRPVAVRNLVETDDPVEDADTSTVILIGRAGPLPVG